MTHIVKIPVAGFSPFNQLTILDNLNSSEIFFTNTI